MSDIPDPPDFELQTEQRPVDPPLDPPRREQRRGLWLAVAALIVVAAVAVYMIGRKRPTPGPVATESQSAEAPAAPAAQPVAPLGADAAPIVLPPLDESDAAVRELIRQLTTHPSIAAWLATDGLIRNAAVVVSNVADGRSPSGQLKVLSPTGRFAVVERSGQQFLDPRSYDRYNSLAAAASSIDADGAARLYTALKPRLEEAFRELGRPETTFDRTVERALVVLLQTPIVDDPVRVEPARVVGYAFVDPKLEALSGAQKQLLRTGPQNVRRIQASVRGIALALGVPAGRLPAPHL